jgi:hypothetical protein
MLRAIAIVVPLITAALLFGFLGGIDMIILNTGIKLSTVFAIANIIIAILVYQNKV